MEKLKILLYSDTIDFGLNTIKFHKFLNPIFKLLRKNNIIEDNWIVFDNSPTHHAQHENTKFFELSEFKNSQDIIEKIKPDLILLTSSELISISLLKASKFNGIPVILIDIAYPAYSISSTPNVLKIFERKFTQLKYSRTMFFRKLLFFTKSEFCLKKFSLKNFFKVLKHLLFSSSRFEIRKDLDLYICSNYFWYDDAIKNGVSKNKIFISGEITFDNLFQNSNFFSHVPHDTTNILFLTNALVEHGYWTKKMLQNTVKSVVKVLNDFKQIQLKIKIHPGESTETYQKIVDKINPSIPVLKKENLTKLIIESDIVITFGQSTSQSEAILFKKPVIHLNFFNESFLLIKKGITIECKSENSLKNILENLDAIKLDSITSAKSVEKLAYKFDGNCGKRAADAILTLLNEKSSTKI